MNKKKQAANKQKALALFTNLKTLLLPQKTDNSGYDQIIAVLDRSIDRVSKDSQTPENEARAVYQNIYKIALVEKTKFEPTTVTALKAIETFSLSGGVWGGMNTLNTANTWQII